MLVSLLVSFLTFASALWFVLRICFVYQSKKLITSQRMTKIGTFYFFAFLFLYFYFFSDAFLFFVSSFLLILCFPVGFAVNMKCRQRQFHSEFLSFISLILISMKKGDSYSRSVQVSLQSRRWKQRSLLESVFEDVTFSQQKSSISLPSFAKLLMELQRELMGVRSNQHMAIERVTRVRERFRQRIIFRQKSMQIWSHFGFQAGLLSLIYGGILTYVIFEMGFVAHRSVIFLSLSLYISGILSLILIARGKKWRI